MPNKPLPKTIRQQIGKLHTEFLKFVYTHNKRIIEKHQNCSHAEHLSHLSEDYTIGDGFEAFIAWCKGKYD